MQLAKNVDRQRLTQMLIDHAGNRPLKWRPPGQHEPKSRAQRINIRADVDLFLLQLFGTREMGCTDKSSQRQRHRLLKHCAQRFGQAKIDHLYEQVIFIGLEYKHDIRRFDVSMNQFLAIRRDERTCHLSYDSEYKIRRQWTLTVNTVFDSFPLHILHRIEESALRIAEVENCGNVRMPQACRRPRFAQKALPRSFAVEILRID